MFDFALRPDGTQVGYIATQENLAVYELYQVALATPGTATKLSAPMQGAGLWEFDYLDDSTAVIYAAEQDSTSPELYRVELGTPGTSTKLSSPLASSGVWTFLSSPGEMRVP